MASCKWTMANIFLLSYLHDDFFLPSDRRHGLYAAGQHGCRFVRCRTLCIERKRLDTHRCDGSFLGAIQLRFAAKAAHTDCATFATSAACFKGGTTAIPLVGEQGLSPHRLCPPPLRRLASGLLLHSLCTRLVCAVPSSPLLNPLRAGA